ncbi:MAG: hypothetical protein IJR18_04100 [Campylobacter sp.]|nr:hypothetical protein [Campylobacter sp.]
MIISSEKKIKIFDNAIFVFICLYFLAQFIRHLNVVKSIGVYTAIPLIIFFIILCHEIAITRFKENFKKNKILFFIVSFLVATTLILSISPYDPSHNSLKEFMRVVKKEYLLFVLLFFWFDGSEKRSKIIFWVLVGSLFYESIYIIINSIINFDPKMLQKKLHIVDRTYSICVDGLFAFCVIAILFVKKKTWLQISLMLFLAVIIILNILTGARASWLALGLTFLFCIFFLLLKNKFSVKTALYIGMFFILAGGAFSVAYEAFPHIKYKLTQKNVTSGRDLILKNRLPLILNSDRALIGLGYGTTQYEKFIYDNRNKATGKLGPGRTERDKNKKVKFIYYWHDEPAFIAYYYHVGVGVIFFIALVFFIAYKGISEYIKNNNYLLLGVSLSAISFYLIRGLFEWFGIQTIIALSALFIVLNYKNKEAVANED